MSTFDRNDRNDRLDEETLLALAATAIRRERADDETVAAAGARAWERIARQAAAPDEVQAAATTQIRGCADIQALLPAYLRGELSSARGLLVQDHTRECVPCRRAMQAARSGLTLPAAAAPERGSSRFGNPFYGSARWGIAAMLAAAVGLGGYLALRDRMGAGGAALAAVQSVQGELFAVDENSARPLVVGAVLETSDGVRTAKDSGAVVKLSDGSLVEMRERSEIAFSHRSEGTTIQLRRGNIIVQAAHQSSGKHLFVATDDCVVSVVGTVFSVNRGTKGSRVAVLQGEVRIAQGRSTSTLMPGQQYATHASLRSVPLADEVSWSKDSVRYLAVVKELQGLSRDLTQAIDAHEARTSTARLDLMPSGTAIYIALPNVSGDLAQAREMLRQRLAENPELQAWWAEHMGASGQEQNLDDLITHLRDFGSYLGEEVAVSMQIPPAGTQTVAPGSEAGTMLVLAEVANAAGLPAFLEQEVARLNAEAEAHGAHETPLRIVHDPNTETASAEHQMLLWSDGDVLAASLDMTRLRVLQSVRHGAANPFTSEPFHASLAQAYSEGVSWLAAVDLDHILGTAAARARQNGRSEATLQRSGFADARYLIAERKTDAPGGMVENRAVLSFDGPRRGVAAWLAAPAPMGSLDFISPEANFAAAFVVKTPAAMVDDLFGIAEANDPTFAQHKAEIEAREGIDLKHDLAEPLGGEFAFAVDGPMLPVPSWKLIVEVYDADRLQTAIEHLLERVNQEAVKDGKQPGRIEPETTSGRPGYALTLPASGLTVHYLYSDGYLIAGPSRSLVDKALQSRSAGYSITGAPDFIALLPQGGQSNFSALVFQNLGSALSPVLGLLGGSGALSADQQKALQALAADAPASLAYAYGEDDRIVAATRGTGVMGLNLGTLMGLGSILDHGAGHRLPHRAGPSTSSAPAASKSATLQPVAP